MGEALFVNNAAQGSPPGYWTQQWSWKKKLILGGILYGFLVATATAKSIGFLIRNDQEIVWRFLLLRSSLLWGLLIVAIPIFLWILNQFNLSTGRKVPSLMVLVVTGLLFTGLHSVVFVSLLSLVDGAGIGGDEFWMNVISNISYNSIPLLSGYILVVGGWHLVEYFGNYKSQQLRLEERKAELLEAKLHTLRQQLNPHYLFNTLHGIHTLMLDHQEQAMTMIDRLKHLLEASSDDQQADLIPLEEELDLATSYLNIEKMRHGDRLQVAYDISPAAMPVLVPTMILQPLLENSVRYAVAQKMQPSHIRIRANISEHTFYLSVEDDGPGWKTGYEKGIGLENTEKRVAFMHPQAQIQQFASELGGAGVRISWPIE
jgi:two-component system LytT family sensor kinase